MKTARLFAASRGISLRTASLAGYATLLACGLTACKSNTAPAPIVNNSAAADTGGPDPAAANMAGGTGTSGQPTQVMGQSQSYTSQQQGENYNYQQAPAPVQQGYSTAPAYPQSGYQPGYDNSAANYDQGYAAGEAAEASTPPPPLPEYEQPPAPDPNDIWTPGYWNYGNGGYYWVPGTWVAAPYYGALWTPPYWGFAGGRYGFHHGYWGRHIGYYGGVDYGFGYIGIGYYGGYWRGHDFFYNRDVNRVGSGFGNVYERPVVVNNIHYNMQPTVRISFNGGVGGINAQPRPFEVAAEHEQHIGPVPAQVALRVQASTNRGNFYAQNQGRPQQVAFAHPPEARAPLPANTPVNSGQPFNRPGAPVGNPALNHPGPSEPMNRPGQPGAQPYNRPNEPATRVGPPAAQSFNRPGQPETHIGNPAAPPATTHIGTPAQRGYQPGYQPGTRPGAPAGNQGFIRPTEPANRPAPAPTVNRQAPIQPRANQGAPNQGFNRPAPQMNHPAPAPTPAPAPRVEAARPAPAPHPQPAAPVSHPAPPPAAHPEAAPHPEGGGHPR